LRFAAEPHTHTPACREAEIRQRTQSEKIRLVITLIGPTRNFSIPQRHPKRVLVPVFSSKRHYTTNNRAVRTSSRPPTADGKTFGIRTTTRVHFRSANRTFSMATQNISAQETEPQPVPKEELGGDSQTHLDEGKLKKFFIGSIDQGTTSTRFIIFDGLGEPVAQHQIEFNQNYPQSGSVFPPAPCKVKLTIAGGMNTTRKKLSNRLRHALTRRRTSS
jgi:hypothetical protein